jgi:hypothetical protein
LVESASERLEQSLNNVVEIVPVRTIQVQGNPGVIGKGLKKFRNELGIEIANFCLGELRI